MPSRAGASPALSRSRRPMRWAAVAWSSNCSSGGRAEDQRLDERDLPLVLAGPLPLEEGPKLLGLGIRADQRVVRGDELAVGFTQPGPGVAGRVLRPGHPGTETGPSPRRPADPMRRTTRSHGYSLLSSRKSRQPRASPCRSFPVESLSESRGLVPAPRQPAIERPTPAEGHRDHA
jgi:hypothetical protein